MAQKSADIDVGITRTADDLNHTKHTELTTQRNLEEALTRLKLVKDDQENTDMSLAPADSGWWDGDGTNDELLPVFHAIIPDESSDYRICDICCDTFLPKHAVELEHCQHIWCGNCVVQVFGDARQSELLWPPKCCEAEITLDVVGHLVTGKLLRGFTVKSEEWGTLAAVRIYCCEPTYAAFIPLDCVAEDRKAVCPACEREVCTTCKTTWHEGDLACPESSEEDKLLVELAGSRNWKRCPSCRSYVERNGGCLHMICSCKEDFCYVCCERWGDCPCTQNEARQHEQGIYGGGGGEEGYSEEWEEDIELGAYGYDIVHQEDGDQDGEELSKWDTGIDTNAETVKDGGGLAEWASAQVFLEIPDNEF